MGSRFLQTYEVTVYPETNSPVDIGEFILGAEDDTIWIKVTSTPDGGCPWPWSYGLITWITDEGRELGTVKVNGVCEGEVFRFGVGRPPLLRTGRFSFTPRSYNLAWVKLGHPWTLKFEASSGVTSSGGGGGSTPVAGSASNSVVNTSGLGVPYVVTGDTVTLNFQ